MSIVRRQAARRWASFAAATGVLVATPVLLAARPVAASMLSAGDVVAAATRSADVPHQGLVEIDASLGIPDLPIVSDETKILSGTTRVRTWWATQDSWRTDTLTGTGEEITFADPATPGGGVRQWSFENNTETEVPSTPSIRLPRADDLVPPQAARRLLSWLNPNDRILALDARRIAGYNGAGAEIVPSDPRTTVGRVDLWVEPQTGLPLEVDVYARGAERPSISTRFLDLDLVRPSPSVLSPALVTTADQDSTIEPDLLARLNSFGSVPLPNSLGTLARITGSAAAGLHSVAAYGSGLTRVFVVPLPDRLAGYLSEDTTGKGTSFTVPGGTGTLLTTSLLSLAVVFGNGQGYIVAGTVQPAALTQAVAALLAAQQ